MQAVAGDLMAVMAETITTSRAAAPAAAAWDWALRVAISRAALVLGAGEPES